MRALLPGLLVVLAPSACSLADRPTLPPEGQIVLYVTTDAILPAPPSEPSGTPGLFDRLSIEIFPSGESTPCAGCARQFSVDARSMDEGRTSMGYVARPGVGGSRARVRLFRTFGAEVVEPRATSTLESVVALPVIGSDGITEITVVLETASLGSPAGTLDAPVLPTAGPPTRGLVGSWEAARRRPCAGEAQAGEICIGGGAFWLGVPAVALPSPDQKHGLEHLVAVSPYFIDATEVTVKSFRDAGIATNFGPGRLIADPECTFTDAAGALESNPVNCVSRPMAEEYCAKKGARLPTEAEYEYVATAFGRYKLYPWGAEAPTCGDAIFGRAIPPLTTRTSNTCAPATGTAPVGTSARDRLAVPGGGEIVDLVGNVTEWVGDDYGEESDPCWAPAILLDPLCQTPGGKQHAWTGRGGFYAAEANIVDAKVRFKFASDPDGRPRAVGIRCARSSDP